MIQFPDSKLWNTLNAPICSSSLSITNGAGILLPNYQQILNSMASLAFIEIAFPLWLLMKGVKAQRSGTINDD